MCHGACTLRGRRRRRTLDASARLCSRAGAAKKSASAPGRAHALPDVHTDRARSGASQAAQGPRTGSVGRRDPGYRYGAPEAGSKYPTHTAISACATRHDHGGRCLAHTSSHYIVSKLSDCNQLSIFFEVLLTGLQSHPQGRRLSMTAPERPSASFTEKQSRQGKQRNSKRRIKASKPDCFTTLRQSCPII